MLLGKLRYALGAFPAVLLDTPKCPACHSAANAQLDRKWFHKLLKCQQCELIYRWPYESADEMENFYQNEYEQSGLTTDLPTKSELEYLLKTRFSDSEKNLKKIVDLLKVLQVPLGSKVLDYGANWGYGVYQLVEEGYNAEGFELSVPRARYASRLKVKVSSDFDQIRRQESKYDVVFSTHVLEHTPDPKAVLIDQMQILKPGGWLVAVFPNGSKEFRERNYHSFHKLWGKVHPVMLDDKFILASLGDSTRYIGDFSLSLLGRHALMDSEFVQYGDLTQSELMIIAKKVNSN